MMRLQEEDKRWSTSIDIWVGEVSCGSIRIYISTTHSFNKIHFSFMLYDDVVFRLAQSSQNIGKQSKNSKHKRVW